MLSGCGDSSDADAGRDAADVVIGPGGQEGVCCPIDDAPSCDCTRTGGWSPSRRCDFNNLCDGSDWRVDTDEYGCPILVAEGMDCLRHDAGPGDGGLRCTPVALEEGHRPVDVILLVDGSDSMADAIASLETNLEPSLLTPLADGRVDSRLIVVARHGDGELDFCVPRPTSLTTDCSGPPVEVPVGFRHYDTPIAETDAICVAFDTFAGPSAGGRADDQGAHLDGWSRYLRPEALKVFVVVSDDRMRCSWSGPGSSGTPCAGTSPGCWDDQEDRSTDADSSAAADVATRVREELLALSPEQFGASGDERMVFHTIGGLAERSDGAPYAPSDPFVTTECSASATLPAGYQWLSIGTGGLRFPSCAHPSFDGAFRAIASRTEEQTLDRCYASLPRVIGVSNPLQVDLVVDASSSVGLLPVDALEDCTADDQYYVNLADQIALCPLACARMTDESSIEARMCP